MPSGLASADGVGELPQRVACTAAGVQQPGDTAMGGWGGADERRHAFDDRRRSRVELRLRDAFKASHAFSGISHGLAGDAASSACRTLGRVGASWGGGEGRGRNRHVRIGSARGELDLHTLSRSRSAPRVPRSDASRRRGGCTSADAATIHSITGRPRRRVRVVPAACERRGVGRERTPRRIAASTAGAPDATGVGADSAARTTVRMPEPARRGASGDTRKEARVTCHSRTGRSPRAIGRGWRLRGHRR